MQYTLHLNLQQIAMLRIAISFWERQDVKDRLIKFLNSSKIETWEIRWKWYGLIKTLVDELKYDLLPPNLETELIHLVKMIGETISSWYRHIKEEYEINEKLINFVDKIQWTSYGTVDTVKTFESYWLNNPNLNITQVYKFACDYALYEHIDDLWNKIPNDIQYHYYNDTHMYIDQHLLTYWKCCRDGDLPNLMRYFETAAENFEEQDLYEFNLIYDFNRSTEENMIRLSAYQGHFLAVKYFWKKLTEEERDESVLYCAHIAIAGCRFYDIRVKQEVNYKESQYAEIWIFFMNQMSAAHKKVFFNKKLLNFFPLILSRIKTNILRMLLFVWPWQELFISVLKDMLEYQDDDSQENCKFLEQITNKMRIDHHFGYSLGTSRYRYLLREAWLIIPASIKQKINICGREKYNFILDLIEVWDISSLKLILNDLKIKANKDEFINWGLDQFQQLIEDDEYEKLEYFMEEIFNSENEKKRFKQKIDAPYDFVRFNQFDLLEKMLDWQCSSLEEKQFMKNKINHLCWCEKLIEDHKFELVEKFLDWKFETEEEKRNFMDHCKNGICSFEVICKIWETSGGDINKANNESSQFLHWFLKSEEEIVLFKRKMLLRFVFDHITYRILRLKENDIYDDFETWCLLDEEQLQLIQQMKQTLIITE